MPPGRGRARTRPGHAKNLATCRYGLQLAGVTPPAFVPPPSSPVARATFVHRSNGLAAARPVDSPRSFPSWAGFLTGRTRSMRAGGFSVNPEHLFPFKDRARSRPDAYLSTRAPGRDEEHHVSGGNPPPVVRVGATSGPRGRRRTWAGWTRTPTNGRITFMKWHLCSFRGSPGGLVEPPTPTVSRPPAMTSRRLISLAIRDCFQPSPKVYNPAESP